MKKRLLLIFLTIIAIFTFNINVSAGPSGLVIPKSIEIENPDKDTIPDNKTNISTEPDGIDIIPKQH